MRLCAEIGVRCNIAVDFETNQFHAFFAAAVTFRFRVISAGETPFHATHGTGFAAFAVGIQFHAELHGSELRFELTVWETQHAAFQRNEHVFGQRGTRVHSDFTQTTTANGQLTATTQTQRRTRTDFHITEHRCFCTDCTQHFCIAISTTFGRCTGFNTPVHLLGNKTVTAEARVTNFASVRHAAQICDAAGWLVRTCSHRDTVKTHTAAIINIQHFADRRNRAVAEIGIQRHHQTDLITLDKAIWEAHLRHADTGCTTVKFVQQIRMRTHHQTAANHRNTATTTANIQTSLRQHFWHHFVTPGQFRTTGKETAAFTRHCTVNSRAKLNVLVDVDQVISTEHTHAFITRHRNALCCKTNFGIRFLHIRSGIGFVSTGVRRCQQGAGQKRKFFHGR